MKLLSLDSVGGASGDMLLATLVDLGADFEKIAALIQAITPEPLTTTRTPAADAGLHGTRVTVTTPAATVWHADPPVPPGDHSDHHDHQHPHEHSHNHHDHGHPHDHEPHDHGPHDHPHDHHEPHDHPHTVEDRPHAPHRNLADILAILAHTAIPATTRRLAAATFRRLAQAEARIHGTTLEAIHFHEVGAADAIADIVGCCYALDLLEVGAIRIGPLPAGCGTIRCAHGEMPNPAPATQLLLAGFTIVQTDEPSELVTPTGAALLATWRAELADAPAQGRILQSGMGFGSRKLQHRPNVLRATLLDTQKSDQTAPDGSLIVMETNLDDCNPQWIGELIERLLEQGALDVWATPIVMKKGRPALTLSVLGEPEVCTRLQRSIFLATPTFGIRTYHVERTILARRHKTVTTPYGKIRVKLGELDGTVVTQTPEYEDCVACARQADVTPRQVADAARLAYGSR